MKTYLPLIFLVSSLPGIAAEKSVEDRLSDLEMKSDLNPIQIKGELILRFDQVTRNLNRGTTAAPDYQEIKFNLNRIRFYLDFNGELSPKLSFYARLSASKQQNEILPASNQNQDPINADQNGRAFRGADVYLERAYFNYKILDNLVFSAGRLSIIDGPPYNLTYGESALGSYPFLAYQNNFDGYALSYSPLDSFTLRFVDHPFSQVARDTNSLATPAFGTNGRQLGKGDVKVFNAEYVERSLGFAKSVSVMAQYLFGDNIQVPDQKLPTTGAYGTSDLTFDVKVTTLYVEMLKVAKSGLNFGMSFASSELTSTGTLYRELVPAIGYVGALTSKDKDKPKGTAKQLVVSYDIRSSALNDPTFGVEYFQASKQYFFANANPLDPLRMYGIHGAMNHIFYVQPIDDALKLRIGMISTMPEYSNSLFGEPTELSGDAKKTDKSAYAELKLNF